MDVKQLDEFIRVVAEYFSGAEVPLNQTALRTRPKGRFQLRERAERFFRTRQNMGVEGFKTTDEVQVIIRRRLGLPPIGKS